MNSKACVRFLIALGLISVSTLTAACGSGQATSGDSGASQYTPNLSEPPPAHTADLPCGDPDTSHLCVALNYAVYENPSGQPVISQAQASENVEGINSVWSQCQVRFFMEGYQTINPASAGLSFQPTSTGDLPAVRQAAADPSRLSVVTTGQWSGELGAGTANAWTVLPPTGPFGAVIEESVGTVYNLIAHELGHYLNLVHVADQANVMNPIIYDNSLAFSGDQCSEARATAISFWGQALR